MIHRFGDRETFSVEPGQVLQGTPTTGVRIVELWAAGCELTCEDNHAFVPAFCLSVEATISSLLSDRDRALPRPTLTPEENHRGLQAGTYEDQIRYFFMSWGPTTDNVASYLFRHGADAILTFEFCRPNHPQPKEIGRVLVATLPERALLRSLHQAVCVLRRGE